MAPSDTVVPYFLYSFGILFREGLEALLVIIALVAGTQEAGERQRVRDIYAGALIAVAVSIALAWFVNHLLGDNTSDTLEGIFQLMAAGTLFYVSSWLTSKWQNERWISFISDRLQSARLSRTPSLVLGLTAFLAVMREGAETIVFFQALTAGATEAVERHAVAAGVGAGALALAVTFIILTRAAYRIPVGSFFAVTTVLLYGLAVIFAGQGIASFQESGVIGVTFVSHVPAISMLGIYPTVETLLAQGTLLLLAAVAFAVPRRPVETGNIDAEPRPGRSGTHQAVPGSQP